MASVEISKPKRKMNLKMALDNFTLQKHRRIQGISQEYKTIIF